MPNYLSNTPIAINLGQQHYDDGVYVPSAKLFKTLVKPHALEKEIGKQLHIVNEIANDKEKSAEDFCAAADRLLELARIHRNIEWAEDADHAAD